MRPKVSRGIKSSENNKSLPGEVPKSYKPSDSIQMQELNLDRIYNKGSTNRILNTCRTNIQPQNYTSRTNKSQKRNLQTKHLAAENNRTYAEIQKERRIVKNNYISRNGSQSRIMMEDQQNLYKKQAFKHCQEITNIDIQIFKILEQENIQCKQMICKLKKELELKEESLQFLRKTNQDLQKKIFETERQFLWLEDTFRNKQQEIQQKNNQIVVLNKQIHLLQSQIDYGDKKQASQHHRKPSSQALQQLDKLKDENQVIKKQSEIYKRQLRNVRKQNVDYRREIARFKKEILEREESWIQMGERSSIRIAEGIKHELKEFGEQRIRQYEQMVKHCRQEIAFLRDKNKILQTKLQNNKQKQIKQLISLKKSFDIPIERSQQRNQERGGLRSGKTHTKSRSMAMLTPIKFNTQQEIY